MKASIYREEHFNAAHRLHNSKWSDKKNKTVFGKCNNSNFHGHNYKLLLKLTGNIDENTGYVYDTKKLSKLIKLAIINKLDHKNLNLDVDEFKHLNPTAENIACVIWNILRKEINEKYQLKITLYETERNFVEYPST
ncbi:MAG: 6-carboxytetrahydropterin synthase [Flavobacteriales bacterium]|nr:6-carboxytetrahydropterin synthase [Flavobacteriales bacterium]